MAESMTGLKRTHRCAELSEANIGEKVTIMGWVQKNRNKGGLVFVDVRDRSGIIQVVFEEGKADAALAASLFHFKELEIMDLKRYLREKGISVRI